MVRNPTRNRIHAGLAAVLLATTAWAAPARQPNFVVILADDVSPEMYGCYGCKEAKTPNLDRLAKEGVMFRTAWACGLCLPSRAEIMTGCYAARTGVWSNGFAIPPEGDSPELFEHFPSFAWLLREAGYATAIAGKWHLGNAEPPYSSSVGFDEYSLWAGEKELAVLPDQKRADVAMENEETPSRYWQPSIVQNGKIYPSKPDEFGPTINADFLCGFMERSVKAGKPFLAYFPTAAPHGARNGMPTTPLYGSPGDNGTEDRQENARRFRALNDYLDVLVGKLEQKSRQLGVYDDTVFIFTSDNGTASIAKSRGTERGCRVPFIAWGGPVTQRDATDEITDLSDILPTLADFAGAELPAGVQVDGKSLKPFLTGAADTHREYICHDKGCPSFCCLTDPSFFEGTQMAPQRWTLRLHMVIIASVIVSSATVVTAVAGERLNYADLVGRLTDLERLAMPVVPSERTFASTSHDRGMSYDPSTDAYRNWSANGDGGGCIRREGDAQVMVDLKGPGVLWRTWSARAGRGHIKIFIDGNAVPVIDKPFDTYFGDYEKDYPGLAMTLSRGRNEFVPISFAKSCKVVVEKGWGMYFHCTHTLFPEGTTVEPFPGFTPEVVAQLKTASDAWNRRGSNRYPNDSGTLTNKTVLTIEPGQTERLLLAGAGAIRALKVKPVELPDDKLAQEDMLRELTISMFWDGETLPSVWAPLGDFFATSPGINSFRTLTTGCIEGTFYSYWYMPYADGAQIAFANDGERSRKLEIELETVEREPAAAPRLLRFNAAWHSDDFTGLDAKRFHRKGGDRWPDWPLLVVEGKGRYVGMTEHIWKYGGWWGEGDEKFFIDGETYPSTVGTGSEDYIGYAWAANPPFITFDSALAAVSRLRPDAQEDTSVCRFHVCDDVPFANSFQGFIEVMPNDNCRPCVYDTCVYWYAEQDVKNPYPIVPLARRRHPRPSLDQLDVVPSTMQILKLHPDAIEGEHLKVLRIGSGKHWVQNMSRYRDGRWSGDAQLIWTQGKQNEGIEIEFPVPKRGRYELMAVFTKAGDYGIFELAVDGKTMGKPIDLYDPKVTTTGEILVGTVQLDEGKHVLKATAIGHNDKARNAVGAGSHIFGLDYLRLQKPALSTPGSEQ